jgi:hypothetical protein
VEAEEAGRRRGRGRGGGVRERESASEQKLGEVTGSGHGLVECVDQPLCRGGHVSLHTGCRHVSLHIGTTKVNSTTHQQHVGCRTNWHE